MMLVLDNSIVNMKAALFDMDGTILNSMQTWLEMGEKFLEKFGLPKDEVVTESFIRDCTPDIADVVMDRYELGLTKKELMFEIDDMVYDAYANTLALKRGVKKFFEILKFNNVQIAIVTSSSFGLVEKMCERTGLNKYVDSIISCGSIGASKHTSKPYDHAVNVLSINKNDAVIFEDALYAIQTAKDSGYFVVGVEEKVMKADKIRIMNTVDRYVKDFYVLINEMEG